MKNINFKRTGAFAVSGAALGFGVAYFAKKNKLWFTLGGLTVGVASSFLIKGKETTSQFSNASGVPNKAGVADAVWCTNKDGKKVPCLKQV